MLAKMGQVIAPASPLGNCPAARACRAAVEFDGHHRCQPQIKLYCVRKGRWCLSRVCWLELFSSQRTASTKLSKGKLPDCPKRSSLSAAECRATIGGRATRRSTMTGTCSTPDLPTARIDIVSKKRWFGAAAPCWHIENPGWLSCSRGKQKYVHRYRWIQGVPLRDGEDALKVNWLEIEILNPRGEVTYRNSFITNLAISANNVAELAACGRARWKIENETFNVLETGGYHIEHNFGHGKQHLASILVTLNLLAFAFHTTCDIADELWRAAREKIGPRRPFFNHLGSITSFLIFDSWQDLLQTLAFAKPPPRPP